MSRLIKMDRSGHATVAEWEIGDKASVDAAITVFHAQLAEGYFAVASSADDHAEHVRELPLDAPLVILRRPIVGG